jgi:hypothetical protein
LGGKRNSRPYRLWPSWTPNHRIHVASRTGPGRSPRCTRCVVLPEAILRKRKYRNAHFAPNFRHHPGTGGHRTPCYVPTPVSTPPGALRDARPRGHFFAIFGGRITPSCQNSVCCSTPFPRRLLDRTKQSKAKQRSTKIIIIILKNVRATIFPTGDDHFGRETKFPPVPVVAKLDA